MFQRWHHLLGGPRYHHLSQRLVRLLPLSVRRSARMDNEITGLETTLLIKSLKVLQWGGGGILKNSEKTNLFLKNVQIKSETQKVSNWFNHYYT